MDDISRSGNYSERLELRGASRRSLRQWCSRSQRGSGSPDRLGRDELDLDSGTINWPTGLLAPIYASDRKKIEKLFRERAAVGNRVGLSSDIKSACIAMDQELRANISSMTTSEYLNCRKFLESLRDENRHVTR